MWEALAAELDKEMTVPPTKILSVGDGPGEPGCYLAAKFGCPTICSDSVVPMVEAAKQRVAAKGLSNVECLLLDMQDLSAVEAASVDVLSSAHAYPFSPDKPKALAEALPTRAQARRHVRRRGCLGVLRAPPVCWRDHGGRHGQTARAAAGRAAAAAAVPR